MSLGTWSEMVTTGSDNELGGNLHNKTFLFEQRWNKKVRHGFKAYKSIKTALVDTRQAESSDGEAKAEASTAKGNRGDRGSRGRKVALSILHISASRKKARSNQSPSVEKQVLARGGASRFP